MAFQVGSAVSALVTPSSQAPEAAPTSSASGRIVSTPTAHQADTVKLSLSARIHQLKSQGQSAHQIATSLGVDSKTVAPFFSGSSAAPAAKPAPAAVYTDGNATGTKAAAPQSTPVAAQTSQLAVPSSRK